METGQVPGVATMVTDRTDTLYEGAFGERILGTQQPMQTDTVAYIASMTKAVTAAAAMQLVEEQKLQLDRPVADFVPEIARCEVLQGFDATGKPRLRAPKRQMTIRQLLTHTAGFGYRIWSPELRKYQEVTGTPSTGSCTNASLIAPLLFDPGDRWCYGIGVDWVGKVVEAASGYRLRTYFNKYLLEPLCMSSTGFRITPAMRTRLAKVHQRDETGLLTPVDFELPQDPEVDMGGIGLYSTAADYLKFLRMILNGGRVGSTCLLRADTIDQMTRSSTADIRVTPLKTAIPSVSNDVEFLAGVPKSWSLAFQVNEAPSPTGRPAGGLMWAGIANSYYWIDMVTGIAGVFITQIRPFADIHALPLYYAFETGVYDALS
ncbi:MAG: beta-lactamase family protein [Spirochaetaceae bacterium]|nr:MAG: beta-lactamase family protein [Spirochaetaceae bacterium]